MNPNKKIFRREFIIYCFSAFLLVFIVKEKFNQEEINIDFEINKKIKKYNSLREIKSKRDFKSAIKSDLINNKTIFVGKKLYTYAEIGY